MKVLSRCTAHCWSRGSNTLHAKEALIGIRRSPGVGGCEEQVEIVPTSVNRTDSRHGSMLGAARVHTVEADVEHRARSTNAAIIVDDSIDARQYESYIIV